MSKSKKEKLDIAKMLAENPAVDRVIDRLVERVLFKKSFIIFSLVNACLIAGVFYMVNSLIIIFDLGAIGGLVFGVLLSTVGGIYILRQWAVTHGRRTGKDVG